MPLPVATNLLICSPSQRHQRKPLYAPGQIDDSHLGVASLIAALRRADAVVLGSPGYHGGISGAVKNAIDYTEEMAKDIKPYFTGKSVGCIATGAGWQGCNSSLAALRDVVHALRGWPTPYGIALNSIGGIFDGAGQCHVDMDRGFLLMARELLSFTLVDV